MLKKNVAVALSAIAVASCSAVATNDGNTNNGSNNGANNGSNNGANNGANNGTNNGANNGTNNGVNNGTNNGVNNGTNNGVNNGGMGWQRIALLDGPDGQPHSEQAQVRGIHCESPDKCVVGTYSQSDEGVIYGGSLNSIDSIVFDGEAMSVELGATWSQQVLGFQESPIGLIARMNHALFLVSADGDITNASSWSYDAVGPSNEFGVGNAQLYFGGSANRWIYLYNGVLFTADAAPSPNTVWAGIWSPNRIPPFPSNWQTLKNADATICDSSPSQYFLPKVGDVMYASDDLDFVIYTAGAVNSEADTDTAGVCVSTDGGATFNHVAFPEVGDEYGPLALHCEDDDHCWAVNGQYANEGSAYVYYTSNASAGTAMTWQRGTLPATLSSDSVVLSDIDFATNEIGYIVGYDNNRALLLKTTDGGATWSNLSGPLQPLADSTKLYAVYALDADHVAIGGEKGTYLTNSNGGQ